MLLLREAEQQEQVAEETERLARLRSLLRMIDREGAEGPALRVARKEIAATGLLSLRAEIPNFRSLGDLFGVLFSHPPTQTDGSPMAMWHGGDYHDGPLDVEVGIVLQPYAAATSVEPPLRRSELPGASVASMVHGAFSRIGEAYAELLRWIDENGLSQTGPAREISHRVSQPASRDDDSNVVEIQIPVARSAQ